MKRFVETEAWKILRTVIQIVIICGMMVLLIIGAKWLGI